jgi:hypothetical protein
MQTTTQAGRALADGRAVGALRMAAVLLLVLAIPACASRHASTLAAVRDKVLPLRNPKVAERLQIESDYDATVRQWLADEGQPDYMQVESRRLLRLFYIQKDYMVVFRRQLRSTSQSEVVNAIGALYHRNFSDADKAALAQVRYNRAGMEMPGELVPQREVPNRGGVPAATPDF